MLKSSLAVPTVIYKRLYLNMSLKIVRVAQYCIRAYILLMNLGLLVFPHCPAICCAGCHFQGDTKILESLDFQEPSLFFPVSGTQGPSQVPEPAWVKEQRLHAIPVWEMLHFGSKIPNIFPISLKKDKCFQNNLHYILLTEMSFKMFLIGK